VSGLQTTETVWLQLPCCDEAHEATAERADDGKFLIRRPAGTTDWMLSANETVQVSYRDGDRLVRSALRFVEVRASQSIWLFAPVEGPVEAWVRSAERFPVSVPIRLVPGDGNVIYGTTIDVSAGGIRCTLESRVRNLEVRWFTIRISLDDSYFEIPSRMAWLGHMQNSEERLVGIRFIDPTTERFGEALRLHHAHSVTDV